MSSDSSSSDSEISGEEDFDDNILKAFEAVKCNLAVKGNGNYISKPHQSKVDGSSKRSHKNSSSLRHKLIYQTFQNDKNRPKKSSDKQEHGEQCDEGNEVNDNLGSFFIDKGLSVPATPADELNDIVAYDLTNIGGIDDSDSESETENLVNCDKINNGDKELERGNMSVLESNKVDNEKTRKDGKKNKKHDHGDLSSRLQADVKIRDVYVNVNPLGKSTSKKQIRKERQKEPEIMKKSVISEDFERQDSIQTTHISVRQQKKQRKIEREKTKGDKWFNMPATELTDERKYDLQVIQMRKALDPKRFYKAHDLKSTPKYFQFGEVVEDATDFYSSRIPKKQRKSTVVEELLADAEFRKFNKRKYEEVQDAKRQGKGPYKHMKRLKKRKK